MIISEVKGKLGVKNVGAIYVWIALIVVFALIEPSVFFQYATVKQVLNEYAVTGLVALGLLLPIACGIYDLSVGAVAGLAGIAAAWSLDHLSPNPWVAVLAGLVVALAFGLVNTLIVLVMRVDSFIGTLATSSIATALVTMISGGNILTTNVSGSFQTELAIRSVAGLTLPVGLMLLGMVLLAFMTEKTSFGRRLYATGYETEVARLGGVRVDRLRMLALLGSATLAGIAGICVTASLGAGDPTVGPGYLLPAFAAVFLGATQFRSGRFNAWGTVVATLMLGTGHVGLIIVGAPSWSPAIFEGVVLIAAVALTRSQGFSPLRSIRGRFGRPAPEPSSGPVAGDDPVESATPSSPKQFV